LLQKRQQGLQRERALLEQRRRRRRRRRLGRRLHQEPH
jgi:hypothetical protein